MGTPDENGARLFRATSRPRKTRRDASFESQPESDKHLERYSPGHPDATTERPREHLSSTYEPGRLSRQTSRVAARPSASPVLAAVARGDLATAMTFVWLPNRRSNYEGMSKKDRRHIDRYMWSQMTGLMILASALLGAIWVPR